MIPDLSPGGSARPCASRLGSRRRWLTAVLCCTAVSLSSAQVRISEFLASNDTGLADASGARPDWIELENVTGAAVSLDGWFLTDSAAQLTKWRVPAVTLPAFGRLVVFASGKNLADPAGELHTNFSLNDAGEYLALVRPDGATVAQAFAPTYPRQRPDVAYGIGRVVTEDVLVTPASAARWTGATAAVPTDWMAPAFDDTAWTSGFASIGYQSAPSLASTDPQAYWPLDGNGTDATANGRNLSFNGGGFAAAVPAAIGTGQSAAFESAEQDYAALDLDVSETAYTSSFWFRTTSSGAGLMTVVDADLGGGGHDRHVFLAGGNIRARTWNDETISSTGKAYANGQWHHVAHVFGGSVGGQKLFVDGVQVASGGKTFSDFNWQRRVNLGFSNDAASPFLNGSLDDVAIWAEALSPAAIQALAQGASPMALSGYSRFFDTNAFALRNVTPSALVRVPFSLPATAYERLELRVRYDDGFVLWLNGTEVARRNAPTSDAWDAVAPTDRPAGAAARQETIDLSAYIALLQPGANVFAVRAVNDSIAGTDFLFEPELVAQDVSEETQRYLTTPTPGAPNLGGVLDFVSEPQFDQPHGFHTAPVAVGITAPTAGSSLVYTTNGSAPSLTNGTVVAPADAASTAQTTLNLTATTVVRAAAFRSGYQPSAVTTASYIFLNQVRNQPALPAGYPSSWSGGTAADYGINSSIVNSTLPGYGFEDALLSLPVVSLAGAHADLWDASTGIYYDTGKRGMAGERRLSLEIIPSSQATGPDLQVECGVRTHGNSSRSHGFTPKHPLRLNFRREYGASKLRARVFPESSVEEWDHLLLRAASTDSWPVVDGPPRWINDKATYLRDQYMRDSMRDLGNAAGHGIYVHLFLNGLYWGVYNLAERPIDDWCSSYLGGPKDEWDVIKDFAELESGEMTAWNAMMSLAGTTPSETLYWRIQGLNPDGTPNAAYPVYLHMRSFIDYMILHIAGGAEDWPDHNYWAARRRGPESDGFHFLPWDQEISNDDTVRTRSVIFPAQPFELVNSANSPAYLYDKLRTGATFKQRFRERVHELYFNNGLLAPHHSRARWAVRQAEIDRAMVAESARWGDTRDNPPAKRETKWLAEMNFMQAPGTGFWDVMFPKQIQRFRTAGLYPSIDPPAVNRPGGPTPAGTPLVFTSPVGTIYYTLDGSDPRAANGTPSASAVVFDGSVTTEAIVPRQSTWKYLVTSSEPADWKSAAADDSAWAAGAGQLGYGDGDEATVIGFGGVPSNRNITAYFRHTFSVDDPAQWSDLQLQLLRDDGAIVWLNGVEVARSNMPAGAATWSTRASTNVGGADESTAYYTIPLPAGTALQAGANTLAVELHQVSPTNDDASFDAALTGSVARVGSELALTASKTVTARVLHNGEWSGAWFDRYFVGTAPASAENVVISELHYNPAPPEREWETAVSTDADDFEFLELSNTSAEAVDFTDASFAEGLECRFAEVVLAPGASGVVVKNEAAFRARYGAGPVVLGVFTGGTGLANSGERLALLARDGAAIFDFAFSDDAPWPVEADGGGPSLVLVAPETHPDPALAESWQLSRDSGGTPGRSGRSVNYVDWAARVFAPGASLTGPDDDADGDGIRNFAEFAFATPPDAPSSLPWEMSAAPDGTWTFTWTRRAGDGLVFTPQVSSDLSDWQAAAVVPVSSVEAEGVVVETVTLTPQGDRAFVRLHVAAAP